MAKNNIKKGDIIKVEKEWHGTSPKGDWCFVKAEDAPKITVWAANADFKADVGDEVQVLDITDVSVKNKKVGETYYQNVNVTALLKNNGASPTADFNEDEQLFDDADGDFI